MPSLSSRVGGAMLRRGISLPRNYIEAYQESHDLRRILVEHKVDCVLDVGANVGQFATRLRLLGYRGAIVSFEPIPRNIAILHKRTDPKFWCHEYALGSQAGTANFNIYEDIDVLSSLLPLVGNSSARIQRVQVRRLDSLLDDIIRATDARRLFLKLDTQGFDLEVVRGAGSRIAEFCGLMSEISVHPLYEGMPHYTETLREYESLGFRLRSLHAVSRTEGDLIIEYNVLMQR